MKKTKIIATVWPASDKKEIIKELYNNWVNIIRFNYSHSNYDYYDTIIESINDLNQKWETNLSILADTKWPEIRTKKTNEIIELDNWEKFLFSILEKEDVLPKDSKKIICDYKYVLEDLNVWDIIDIDTWLLKAEIISKKDDYLECIALNSHIIKSLRHVNLPWIKIKLPWITEQDKKDIDFALTNNLDYIALSFVRNKWNINELKDYLAQKNKSDIKIISKIESQEALDNLDEIIDNSDWIMIARWDLWAEIPFEKLPIVQREIAKKAWKFFIVATQMLESMLSNPIPTRAELTDIFNAVMQKADCTMLSWETAAWDYPIESAKYMSKVIETAESSINYHHNYFDKDLWIDNDKKLLVRDAIYTAENTWAKALIVFTRTWFMAKTAAAFRPNIPVFSFTFEDKLQKKLNILFWNTTFTIEKKSNEENVENAINLLEERWFLNKNDKIVTLYDIEYKSKIIPSIQIRKI